MAETPEDFEFIEEQLKAREDAERSTAKQKATLEILTQQSVAWLLGVSARHIRDHQPARNVDGTYNGPDVVNWYVSRRLEEGKKSWERNSDNIKSAVERQAEARAIKLEEEAKGIQDTFVPKADVRLEFMEMAAAVRSELEAVPKALANDFPVDVREQLVRELKNQLKQVLRRLAARGSQFDE